MTEKTLWRKYLKAADREQYKLLQQRLLQDWFGKRPSNYASRRYLETKEAQDALNAAIQRDPVSQAIATGQAETCSVLTEEYNRLHPLMETMYTNPKYPLNLVSIREKYRAQTGQARKQDRPAADEEILAQFPEHLQACTEKLLSIVEFYFSRCEVTPFLASMTKMYVLRSEILHEDTLAQFMELFSSPAYLHRYILAYFGQSSLHDIYAGLYSAQTGHECKGRSIRPYLKDVQSDIWNTIDQAFTSERLLELLQRNPIHCRALERVAKIKRLHSLVLGSIPDQYQDLYPMARMLQRQFILHIGPTNSGKTHDAIQRLMDKGNGVYLGPLRLLAFEQYERINKAGIPCSLLTGEEQKIEENAKITASTIEMADLHSQYEVAVIDEGQMIADLDRGGAWTAAILGICAKEIHVCAAENAEELLKKIIESCGDKVTVQRHVRQTPLLFERRPFHFPEDVRSGDALIVFSKRNVHAVSSELQHKKIKCSMIYGALPYDVRHRQAALFSEGVNDVVVSTDAIGMGMNLPVRRIVFLEQQKFDGHSVRSLTSSEVKQIGGRAGRYGLHEKGFVATSAMRKQIEASLAEPDAPLHEAVIQFPETLLSIQDPLIDILERWEEITPHEGWSKAALERMLKLTRWIDNPALPNDFIYSLITIPFDEDDTELFSLWGRMVNAEIAGEHLNAEAELPRSVPKELWTTSNLDRLEEYYRICDLLYNYCRRFLKNRPELLRMIELQKADISDGISHILSTQRLRGKLCRSCRRPLPWNFPYAICEECYEKQHEWRGYYYY